MPNKPLSAALTDVIVSLKKARRKLQYIEQELQLADSLIEPLAFDSSSLKWPTEPQEFGAKLRAHRLEARLTIAQLAKLDGVMPKTIHNLEVGRHLPSLSTMDRIVRAFIGLAPRPNSP